MGSVFRKTLTRSLPAGAELFTKAGEPKKTCATKQVDLAVCEWLQAEQAHVPDRVGEAVPGEERVLLRELKLSRVRVPT